MPTPKFLTADVQSEWLPADVLALSDLDLRIWRAEQEVIGRYRRRGFAMHSEHYFTSVARERVYLRGYEEDPDEMDEGLLTAIRDVVARIVERDHRAPEEGVASYQQGERAVTYRESPKRPASVYAPLRDFDERPPIGGYY